MVKNRAFESPSTTDSWKGTSGIARVGSSALSTGEINANSEGCDAPIGSLTSPAFIVDAARPYSNLLMSGGNGSETVGARVISAADDSVITSFNPNSCRPFLLTVTRIGFQ